MFIIKSRVNSTSVSISRVVWSTLYTCDGRLINGVLASKPDFLYSDWSS